MNGSLARLLLGALVAASTTACALYPPVAEAPDYGRPLPAGASALIELRPDERRPDMRATWYQREEIAPALARSIEWTRSRHAAQFFPVAGVTHERALASLERFAELLEDTRSPEDFARRFEQDFAVFKSAGWDGAGGGVLFTGYCTPLLAGSLQRTARYSHPLHALPPDLVKADDGTILGQQTAAGLRPYPQRAAILASSRYRELEIVWLEDPIDAYIAHVNGSAFVELESGEIVRFGYAGKNGRTYTSLGKELIAAGRVSAEEMSLAAIRRWAADHPNEVDAFLARNESYVFFTPIEGNPRGSLNVEVTSERTIATDKTIFPRAALCFVEAELPTSGGPAAPFRQLMLDQDTGGAIRTAGRADLYLGVGPRAERLSGATRSPGQLYYFFLRQ
ncbi:MAG: MltA domain-containing protein [Planctomycetota bacterium]